jgi:hypothetical protein
MVKAVRFIRLQLDRDLSCSQDENRFLTILSKSSGDNEDMACWAFAASSFDSFIPNCSLMFAIISGLMFFIIFAIICQKKKKDQEMLKLNKNFPGIMI